MHAMVTRPVYVICDPAPLLNPSTPGDFCQNCVFGHFGGLQDFGQTSFNLVQKEFPTQQFALLATSIAFYDILVRVSAEIKIELRLYAFRFLKF